MFPISIREGNMKFEEEYQDVLQNIESCIISVYRENSGMTDHTVIRSLESVIEHYIAEKRERPPRHFSLSDTESEIFQRVVSVCEWRLGRSPDTMLEAELISLDEIIKCLKRVLKSAQFWNKQGGRRGYWEFVSQYIL
jgi:hypothetical protein